MPRKRIYSDEERIKEEKLNKKNMIKDINLSQKLSKKEKCGLGNGEREIEKK